MLGRRSMVVGVAGAAFGVSLHVSAQDNAPQPAPAPAAEKAPAPAPPASADENDVRGVLKSLAKALQEGDGKQIRAVIYAATPTEKKMVDAMADMAVEIARLHKVANKAYGEEQARGLTGDLSAEVSRIDQASITFAAETATVTYKAPQPADAATEADASAPLILKKVEGRWHVPIAELSKDTTPEEIEERLKDLSAQTKVITELTSEIADGKHKSAEKAAEAWQVKMLEALRPAKPETRKAEEPGKGNAEKENAEKGR